MKKATAKLKSVSPYSQSKYHTTPKLPKEGADDYDKRTWREKCHWTESGNLFIPPMAFKNCLSEAAKFLGIQIVGKGKSTYTKHIEAGVLVTDPLVLPITRETIQYEDLFVPADGKRGGDKRVVRRFPMVYSWEGTVEFHILDETVTQDVFLHHLTEAGKFIGIGRWRPRNNGLNGRFKVEGLDWQ